MKNKKECTNLDVQSFGKVFAIIFGLNSFLTAFFPALGYNVLWWNNRSLAFLSAFFPGISPTLIGALLGLVWGIVSGALFGLVTSWLYNKVSK